jgi:hypothetical protein
MLVKTLLVALLALVINIPLGMLRGRSRKFSLVWWLYIHASIPLLVPLRICLNTPLYFIPVFIGLAVAGQLTGSRYVKRRTKNVESAGGATAV